MGIHVVIEFKVKALEVYGDSAVVIYQLRGEWESRDAKLIPYHAYIQELIEEFDEITFHHIPREDNQLADALAILSSMFKASHGRDLPVIKMQIRDRPAYCQMVETKLDGRPWYHNIKCYLKERKYPSDASKNDKKNSKKTGNGFLFKWGGALQKKP